MSRTPVHINLPGLNRVLRSAQGTLDAHGRRMQMAAGGDFEYVAAPHKWTGRGYLRTKNSAGRKQQADNAVLERVLGSR